mgnify:CR=1 FL=1
MIDFNFTDDRPIYIQLVEQLELYIVSGRIPVGEKLPSVRELACHAKVNPSTMQRALIELENLKLIFTERTNGKYVTTDSSLIETYRTEFAEDRVKQYLIEMSDLGFDRTAAIKYLKSQGGKHHD